MAGCDDSLTITEHIKRAMEISVEKMAEFIKQIPEHNLTDRFFMDILIISCANGSPNKKQTEFLAEIADTLGLEKDRIKYLCECTVAVLEQDFSKYTQISRDYNEKSKELNKYYYSPVIADTPLFDEYKEFKNLDSVVIENMRIKEQLGFYAVKDVILKGCTFDTETDYEYPVLYLGGVKNLTIENCIFQNLQQVILLKSAQTKLTVSDSSFINCHRSLKNYAFGTIIYSSNRNYVTFERCIFKNISADGNTFGGCSAISYENIITANNCEFYNCTGAQLFGFKSLFSGSNNKYIGCVRLFSD